MVDRQTDRKTDRRKNGRIERQMGKQTKSLIKELRSAPQEQDKSIKTFFREYSMLLLIWMD